MMITTRARLKTQCDTIGIGPSMPGIFEWNIHKNMYLARDKNKNVWVDKLE